ncbi:MAG: EF-hand domain-containing protein [Kordiimonadaceae bacterium]|nr:EF-hand domain-containing protein [Kordiimonadaceae bacterium]
MGGLIVGGATAFKPAPPEPENPLIAQHFTKLDINQDQLITLPEFAAAFPETAFTLRFHYHNVELGSFRSGSKVAEKESISRLMQDFKVSTASIKKACEEALNDTRPVFIAGKFRALDENHDNLLSSAEFAENDFTPNHNFLTQAFEQVDIDKNGLLTLAETQAQPQRLIKVTYRPMSSKVFDNALPVPPVCFDDLFKEIEFTSREKMEAPNFQYSFQNLTHVFKAFASISPQQFSELDHDKNSKLNFDEFATWYY